MKVKCAVVICLFVSASLGGVGWAIHHNSYEAGKSASDQEWKTNWANRDLADKAAQLAQEKEQRDEERRRQTKTEEIVRNAETEKQNALAEAAAANDVAGRLRGELAGIRRQFATSETGKLSANVASRQTAAEAINMLADLYEESDRRAGEIAQYADAAVSAGSVCERTYDAVTRSVE
ncbi:DUF2514 domain-containing protein [Citrobacter portucalensis]|uniref:DUF2514 family protein n=1 Tax=Citrobacter portucalensis TaxID=1639133 RepID=UPI00226BBD7A|nr:DUF2514 family protein [Citrobacter portucalensis]MCX9034762.1 DUF2514 domain-containing protein [Citrobacter portucalensis]